MTNSEKSKWQQKTDSKQTRGIRTTEKKRVTNRKKIQYENDNQRVIERN